MWKFLVCFFLPACFLFACGNAGDDRVGTTDTGALPEVPPTKKMRAIAPDLFKADSLQILYYNDPVGDSLRYTRYFSIMETADTGMIKSLVAEMDRVYVQEPGARPCRSEGKIYFLKGEDVLKTVYFSTRGDTCSYFYLIKDGAFIYFPMSEGAESWLKERRQAARKP